MLSELPLYSSQRLNLDLKEVCGFVVPQLVFRDTSETRKEFFREIKIHVYAKQQT